MSDPTMNDAVAALQRLSNDSWAQELAFRREIEAGDYAARLERQFEKGIQQERASSLTAIRNICASFGIALDTQRQQTLEHATPEAIAKLLHALAVTRAWPESEDWAGGR
jgi:hypothetical protein